MLKMKRNQILKPIVALACLSWLIQLVVEGCTAHLGANPVERITHRTGLATLILLLAGLAITPLRRWTGVLWLIQYRRLIGLFAFFYACLHLLTYLVLDQSFNFAAMGHDVLKRPFIFVGTLAWLILLLLALTSTQKAIRRLGRNWTRLHRLVYFAASAGCIHFYWLVKRDKQEPLEYIVVLVLLLSVRLIPRFGRQQPKSKTADAD
jgi:sulfoxide reductase heme-binding subunit YedZ